MEEKPRTTPYPLRMPDELRAQLEESAKRGARSLHAEIIARLESTFSTTTASPAVDLSRTVQELESLQQLGTLNYELQRANYRMDTAKLQFSSAYAVLQKALALGDKDEQEDASEKCSELQVKMNELRAEIAQLEEQIGRVHFDRKLNGLKELRDVQPISTSVEVRFEDAAVPSLKKQVSKKASGH
ncbi:Arc-like DNA binding dprotein [Comamonas aquatilis]|uniref:Arc family DNA-binding protein n=1 Tax=Comamonas aquatilis TaxID=1778406 RepID=UPI0039EE4AAD